MYSMIKVLAKKFSIGCACSHLVAYNSKIGKIQNIPYEDIIDMVKTGSEEVYKCRIENGILKFSYELDWNENMMPFSMFALKQYSDGVMDCIDIYENRLFVTNKYIEKQYYKRNSIIEIRADLCESVNHSSKACRKEEAESINRKLAMIGAPYMFDSLMHLIITDYSKHIERLDIPKACTAILPWNLSNVDTDTVIINEGCRKIYDTAAMDGKMQNIEISGTVNDIGEFAFSGCKELKSVVLHKGIKRIHDCAFLGCDKIKEVFVPKSTKLGRNVFDNTVRIIRT